ncbi:TadE/TadG family type IV pilus assembly protein [Zavarzinia sp.]|uniref:TadE/TadG family type IV pilus assembly protein n=1 Tax=Zavarzinia sp. TaxID=2027920 RepID=UPI0035666A81
MRHHKCGDRGQADGERGASIIEFALVAALMFMLLFGILSYGEVFSDYVQLRHRLGEISRLVSLGEDAADRQTIFTQLANEVQPGFMSRNGCVPTYVMDSASSPITITATYDYQGGACRIMPQIPLVPLPATVVARNSFTVTN